MTLPSFTCPVCGMTSHNPNDVKHGYCGRCHDWTGDTPGARSLYRCCGESLVVGEGELRCGVCGAKYAAATEAPATIALPRPTGEAS